MKILKTILKILGIFLGLLVIIYLLGPKPKKPDFSKLHAVPYSIDLHQLEENINRSESELPVKKDNQARIIWATPYTKTPYSIVYLHGNGASQEEGDPMHEALAHRYGCNLYLSRLKGHGLITEDPMLNMDAAEWMQSALDAIEVGKAIGDKVILVSCSTGSTLGLYLEAKYPGLVAAHIMFSPNIDIYDPKSAILDGPWGLQIARKILKSKTYSWAITPSQVAQQYWYTTYRIEGLVTLKSMIDATMTASTFKAIKDPVFLAYYYYDQDHQDKIVSVTRMKEMYEELGTPAAEKKNVPLKNAGTHMIATDIFNDNLNALWTPLADYCDNVLKLPIADTTDYFIYLDLRPKTE
jgi:pimeloyl-ACP methyl ester carboxylesterase